MTKHGEYKNPSYATYCDMIRRCRDKSRADYKNYGGRGIEVCKRWRDSFVNFLEDMGTRPTGKTIERKNTNEGYSPDNCIWATRTDQNRNSRNSKRWHIQGKIYNSSTLAAQGEGVVRRTIHNWCESQARPDCFSVPAY